MPCSYYSEGEEAAICRRELNLVTRLLCSVMKLNPYYRDRNGNIYNILAHGFVDGLDEWVKDHAESDKARRVSENYIHYIKLYPSLDTEQIMANVDEGVFVDVSDDKEFYERVVAITKSPLNVT